MTTHPRFLYVDMGTTRTHIGFLDVWTIYASRPGWRLGCRYLNVGWFTPINGPPTTLTPSTTKPICKTCARRKATIDQTVVGTNGATGRELVDWIARQVPPRSRSDQVGTLPHVGKRWEATFR